VSVLRRQDPTVSGVINIDLGHGLSGRVVHLIQRYVNTGDSVTKGQLIGRIGGNGGLNSTGEHLHYDFCYFGVFINPNYFFK